MNYNGIKNLKVVELAGVLAGPSVGMFFAELGADVVKIENKKNHGDVTRSWKLPIESKDTKVSAYFSSVNYRKRYISADFNDAEDFQKVLNELSDADIVIANFKKGDAEKFKLDYHTLSASNPKLIYGEISGFGEESDRVAYDLILQAESGFMFMNGTPDSGPVKMPVALIDILAGHQLKEGILIALLERIQTQKGCRVHVSLFDSALASLANQASNYLMQNHIPQPIGSKHPNIAPYGEIFETADGIKITFAIGSDAQFAKFCQVLNIEFNKQSEFATNPDRVKNRAHLEILLKPEIKKMEAQKLISALHEKHVPVAEIKSLDKVFQSSESKIMLRTEMIDGVETIRVSGNAFKISKD